MSVDKLVDSTQLDADLTTVANAIRTKGGTAAQLSFPSGMAQAIADLPSGGSDLFEHVRSAPYLFRNSTNLPAEITLNLPSFGNETNTNDRGTSGYMFNRAYQTAQQVSATIDVTINFPTNLKYFDLTRMLFQAYGIRNCKITGNLSGVYSYNEMLDYMSYLRSIDMEFDFTSCVSAQNIYSFGQVNYYINNIRFKQGTLNQNCSIVKLAALNDTSLVSIANGLSGSVTGKTITLHSTPKARCNTLMGTVTDGVFTADPSGNISLQDFITNTKGWTLA